MVTTVMRASAGMPHVPISRTDPFSPGLTSLDNALDQPDMIASARSLAFELMPVWSKVRTDTRVF